MWVYVYMYIYNIYIYIYIYIYTLYIINKLETDESLDWRQPPENHGPQQRWI